MLNISKIMAVAALVLPAMATAVEDSGRWVLKEKGVIVDTFTDLQWTQRDNLYDINWPDAKAYCEALPLAGGGWRLPTIQELSQVYTAGRDGTTPCGDYTCKVSPKFYLTSVWFWSNELTATSDGSSGARGILLSDGDRDVGPLSGSNVTRALCVRRRS